MEARIRARRAVGEANRGEGARTATGRRCGSWRRSDDQDRAPRALLDEPLLVTSGINVRYLTTLASSNVALLVEPDGVATLFTDFRYAQRASALDIRFERTARAVIGDLATRLAGRRRRRGATC